MLRANSTNTFISLASTLTTPANHGHVLCSPLQFSLRWQKLQSSTGKKEVANIEEDKAVEVGKKEQFEVDGATLFYARASGPYQQNWWSKRLKRTRVV